jgi:hypothetical protein
MRDSSGAAGSPDAGPVNCSSIVDPFLVHRSYRRFPPEENRCGAVSLRRRIRAGPGDPSPLVMGHAARA